MCDETGRATSAVESNNLVGRGHAWAGRWASLVQTNMQKRKEPATCDASHARFPGEGHTLFSDGDRRLRTLRSGRAGPGVPRFVRLRVCLCGSAARTSSAHRCGARAVRRTSVPTAQWAERSRARGRRMAIRAINAAPVRASHLALVPPQATTLPAILLSNFFLSFSACSFWLAAGRTTWATSGPCHVIPATRAPRELYPATSAARVYGMRSGNRHFGGVVRHALATVIILLSR